MRYRVTYARYAKSAYRDYAYAWLNIQLETGSFAELIRWLSHKDEDR